MQLKLRSKELKIWKIPDHMLCIKSVSAVTRAVFSPYYHIASKVAA